MKRVLWLSLLRIKAYETVCRSQLNFVNASELLLGAHLLLIGTFFALVAGPVPVTARPLRQKSNRE